MKKPNRIGLSLFDEELLSLINASAKIFPITQEDVDNNYNPNEYEYGRVDNHIYRWRNSTNKWEYIIADDVDISWEDIKNKPVNYNPENHTHNEVDIQDLDKYSKSEINSKLNEKANIIDLHEHSNKLVLDKILQSTLDKISSAFNHIVDTVKHITSEERSLWNKVTNKADKTYVDMELDKKANLSDMDSKSDVTHNHDGRYYKQTQVDSKLDGKSNVEHTHSELDILDLDKYTQAEVDIKLDSKSNITHTHSELHTHTNKTILDKLIETAPEQTYDISNLQYIEDIVDGYTEGHSHANLDTLKLITPIKVDGWDNAVDHISDSTKHITIEERNKIGEIDNKVDNSRVLTDVPLNAKFTDTLVDISGKADKTYVDTELNKKANNTTMVNHVNNSDIHVLQTDKDRWDGKAEGTTLSGHTGNTTVHVTSEDRANWDNKQDVIGYTPANAINEHTHNNKSTIDKFSEVEGKPFYNGEEIATIEDIPVNTSELNNDTGYITINEVPSGVQIGGNKPTDGSMWYEII